MLKAIKNSLVDFFNFLKNPKDEQDIDQSTKQKVKRLFTLLIIDIPIMILLSILINYFATLGWVKIENHQVKLLLEIMPIELVFFFTLILIPFIEEIIFRLFLKYKRNYLILATTTISPQTKNSILRFWKNKYVFVFYFSALYFALIHVANFDTKNLNLYLIPFLVFPQFIIGLIIGYLRVRYNFMLGYLFHAIHNTIFITTAFFAMEESSILKLNLETDYYKLKIEEVSQVKYSYIHNQNKDSISYIGTDFKSIISILTKKDYDLIDSNDNLLLNKKITLNYRNKSDNNINKDSLLLKKLSDLYLFKIENTNKNQKVYNLIVNDSIKLYKYRSKAQNDRTKTSVSGSSTVIKFDNSNLEQIARNLSVNYNKRFEVKDNIYGNFNIAIPNNNFSELKKTLENKYGIKLEVVEKEVEYLFINVQN